jgi:hypothetical protein
LKQPLSYIHLVEVANFEQEALAGFTEGYVNLNIEKLKENRRSGAKAE